MQTRISYACPLLLCLLVFNLSEAVGQSPQQRDGGDRSSRRVYRDRVIPHWSADGNRFWYRNELRGKHEFILVDAVEGQRALAFDHQAVANALGGDAQPDQLPIERLEFTNQRDVLMLVLPEQRVAWNFASGMLIDSDEVRAELAVPGDASAAGTLPRTGAETEVTFDNRMNQAVEIYWVNGDGGKQSYGKIAAGSRKDQHTFGGHRWSIVTSDGRSLGEIVAADVPIVVTIDGRQLQSPLRPRRGSQPRRSNDSGGRSPDGKWMAEIKDFNLIIRPSDSEEVVLATRDGREGLSYGHLNWSADSQSLVALRTESAERLPVHLIRSSPKGGGRAQLESRPYALPGDAFPRHELNVFHLPLRLHHKPEVDRFEHEWDTPRVRWSSDSQSFTYEQTDRGHQRYRVIEIQARDGRARNLIDERTDTFVWTAHTENSDLPRLTWLDDTGEMIYATEQSGWRHLVLLDAKSGQPKNAITSGSWVVRGIENVDVEKRQVWFRASGCFEQDPYLIHYGRVNFDGSGLTWLTQGNGNHTLQYSPDRRFLLDSYSRVDEPPATELRRAEDGGLVCPLERADISLLQESGWQAPEVFSAKGRDGQTDIWGIICRPRAFDPQKSYPVIEDIYAGPHGSFVPKSFSATQRYESLTNLGFIVVKIDGMGTANRSKAFHDVCWKNLGDAGFEDRIAWMRAAAARYPYMDLTRVGIYGTSAGGQNAAAAVIFHPEFYKAAVASCGCHDNRMDKASWNEQWMGYPVGSQYSASSNIDNAHRLGGKLLLIVGEMDTNVPPESTMRLADALIRADKDFDLLVVPNAGHGNGGPYGVRRMHEFFTRHLGRSE